MELAATVSLDGAAVGIDGASALAAAEKISHTANSVNNTGSSAVEIPEIVTFVDRDDTEALSLVSEMDLDDGTLSLLLGAVAAATSESAHAILTAALRVDIS